jgi:hypothetical protein
MMASADDSQIAAHRKAASTSPDGMSARAIPTAPPEHQPKLAFEQIEIKQLHNVTS